jgi:hypothetical protein
MYSRNASPWLFLIWTSSSSSKFNKCTLKCTNPGEGFANEQSALADVYFALSARVSSEYHDNQFNLNCTVILDLADFIQYNVVPGKLYIL